MQGWPDFIYIINIYIHRYYFANNVHKYTNISSMHLCLNKNRLKNRNFAHVFWVSTSRPQFSYLIGFRAPPARLESSYLDPRCRAIKHQINVPLALLCQIKQAPAPPGTFQHIMSRKNQKILVKSSAKL